MAAEPSRVAVLGEVMIELRPLAGESGRFDLGYAGDTFNTAVHLARLGVETSYLTMLGSDPFSDAIIARATREGLAADRIFRHESARPGLYLIRNDPHGEREFFYWREASAARQLLQDPQRSERVIEYLRDFPFVYLSGITLAVMGQGAADAFWQLIESLHGAGVRLLFDPNYRARLWPELDTTRTWYRRMLARSHWTFPTLEDETGVWGLHTADAVLDFHRSLGVREVAFKGPHASAIAQVGDEQVHMVSGYTGPVVDTSGAGDAFNAAYIAARLRGCDLTQALTQAHAHAATVVAVHGALP